MEWRPFKKGFRYLEKHLPCRSFGKDKDWIRVDRTELVPGRGSPWMVGTGRQLEP